LIKLIAYLGALLIIFYNLFYLIYSNEFINYTAYFDYNYLISLFEGNPIT